MTFDMTKIRPQTGYVYKMKDPLNPHALVPVDLDAPVLGKKYSQKDLVQTIMTQLERYSKSKSTQTDPGWRALKGKLQRHFVGRYFKKGSRFELSNEDLARHINPVIEKMKQTGGLFQDLNISLRPLSQTYTIHFFMKDIVKAVMAKTNDADKVGQGISAWSKTLNAVFCPIFRAIEERFVRCLNDNIIYENGTPESVFDFKISELYDHNCQTIVNDFKQFDDKQDANTQFLEDVILELFLGEKFLRLYRQMRLKAKQKSSICSLWNLGCKNSGESATLFTNTLVNMFYCCLTMVCSGIRCEGYKGDDSFINAEKIELVNLIEKWNASCHLQMQSDIDFPLHADFVSYWLSKYGIIPDILKILCKGFSKDLSAIVTVFEDPSNGFRKENIKPTPYYLLLRQAFKDKLKFLTYPKLVYLKRIYRDLYGLDDHQFNMVLSCFYYYAVAVRPGDNSRGFNAIYHGEPTFDLDVLSEAEKNQKRVKQTLKTTEIRI